MTLRDPVIVALGLAAAFLAAYLVIPYDAAYGSSEIRLELVMYSLSQLLAFGMASVVVVRVARAERLFWGLLAAALGVIFVYDLPWSVAVWSGNPPPPHETISSTLLALVPATLFYVLLISMTSVRSRAWPARLRFAVGGAFTLTVVFVAYLVMLARPFLAHWGITESMVHLRSTMHAVIGLGMLIGVAAIVAGLKVAAWKAWEKLLVAGFAVYGIALALTPAYYVATMVMPTFYGQFHEALLMAGPLLVAAAALSRLLAGRNEPVLVRVPPSGAAGIRGAAVFAMFILVSFVAAALAAALSEPGSPDNTLYLVTILVLTPLTSIWIFLIAGETASVVQAATLDPVSGAQTLDNFKERLDRELDLARRCGEPLAVMLLDADGFRQHANVHGSMAAEHLLREVRIALAGVVGSAESVGRVEDNMFACALLGATRSHALEAAERVRVAVKEITPVTASAGVAVFPEHGWSSAELFEGAATALRWAKAHGKDRVQLFSEDMRRNPEEHDGFQQRRYSHLSSVRALAAAVDARHPDTRYHSESVADLAVLVARELGFDGERLNLLEQAALMHDVGKIGVADDVLTKAGPLTRRELERMREHSVLGERILASTSLTEVLPWVRAHHERWDGTGYPDGLAGPAIPLEARILAVCDAYDAMSSPRTYRARMSPAAALQEIDLNMGLQFDPDVAETFIRVLRRA